MADRGHELTDEMLSGLESRIKKEYARAARDTKLKLEKYLDKIEDGRKEQLDLLKAGKITQKEYNDWIFRHTMIGERWDAMRNTLAKDMHNANVIATGMIKDEMPDVYALNMNYGTYNIEHDGGIDTGFTLYNHDTAEYLLGDERELMPPPSARKAAEIKANKDMQWNKQHIQSAVLQGILQGESPYDVAARLMRVAQMNASASIRYARTMTTSAENAGRYEAYRRADKLGVDLTIEWQATLDNRTRHEHRMLHGERRNVDEPFEVDGVRILYPAEGGAGASDIPQSMIWNCRCTLLAWVKGFEGDTVKSSPKMEGMSFEEWQQAKAPKKAENYQDARIELMRSDVRGMIHTQFADAPQSYRQALLDSVDQLSPEMLEVVRRTSDGATVNYFDESGTCQKLRGSDTINMYRGDKTEQEFVNTFWHEYGHLTDKSTNGGYSLDVHFTDRRGNEHSYTVTGIAGIADHEGKYAKAASDDINAFLQRYGLDSKYESGVSEYGGRYLKAVGGDYIDPLTMPFEQSKELSDALTEWVHETSGLREAWDYLYNMGYPRDPEWNKYFETYLTPKRQTVKTREKYKGATVDWQEALRAVSEAQDAFTETHDMTSLCAKQKELADAAHEKEHLLGFVTDTFDEAAFGAFTSVAVHGGHTAQYYMEGGHDEYVANVFASLATNDPTITDGLKDLCPNIYELTRGITLG